MKRIFVFLLSLVVELAVIAPVANASEIVVSGKCGDTMTWALDSEGLLTVSGTGDMNASPWPNAKVLRAVIEPGVESIHKDAFFGCTNLEFVEIPGTVKIIRDNAFSRCASLTQIEIPEGVETIGSNVFSRCTGLTRVSFPASLKTLGTSVFYDCAALEEISVPEDSEHFRSVEGVLFDKDGTTLLRLPGAYKGIYRVPAGVTTLGYEALRGCAGLTELILPDTLTAISDYALAQCSGLAALELPASVSRIGEGAFLECTGLKALALPEGVEQISPFLLYRCTALETLSIPDSVTWIAEHALNGCAALQEVTLPEALKEIGYGSFWNCSSLTEVKIPANVKYIGDQPFDGCTALAGIWVDPANSRFSSCDRGVLYNAEKTHLLQTPGALSGSYTVPASVTKVASCAFDSSAGLTAILTEQGSQALSSRGGVLFSADGKTLLQVPCGKTGRYSVPNGVTEIGYDAFHGSRLAEVSLPDSVKSLSEFAFYDCKELKAVTLGAGVESLGAWAFSQCTGLERVIFRGGAPSMEFDTFESVTASCYYPEDETWTEDVMQDYEGDLTWLPLSQLPESPILPGDANGDGEADYQDALLVLRHSIGLEQLPEETVAACDLNADGEADYNDALTILRRSIGLE